MKLYLRMFWASVRSRRGDDPDTSMLEDLLGFACFSTAVVTGVIGEVQAITGHSTGFWYLLVMLMMLFTGLQIETRARIREVKG